MQNLKKLSLALALTIMFAMSCGAVIAAELVVVAHDDILASEGVQVWLSDLAGLGVTTRLVNGADFEAVKTSPFLAVLVVHEPALNVDLVPLVITSETDRTGLDASGTRKFFCYDNKFAEGQVLFVFSSARIGGLGNLSNPTGGVFQENRDGWVARLAN